MLEFVGLGAGENKDTTFSGFHELIRLPDIPFPFYSLRGLLGKSDVILLLPWPGTLHFL